MVSILLFLILTSFASPAAQQRAAEVVAEIKALAAFKLNLHDPLGVLDSWDPSMPSAPCQWRGVGCSNDGRVVELRLPRLQLGGPLTDRIADLRLLRRLSLRSNHFNGSIPAALSRCTLLRTVFLQYNSFSGGLPPDFTNLTHLLVLNVANNLLSGDLSKILFPRSLQFLDASSNSFSGRIIRSLANSTLLQLINLSYNRFTGDIPEDFGVLQRLQFLWLDDNLLEGTLPSAISNCSSLLHFSAEGNAIGGVIPQAIGALPNLQVLSLSRNDLTGSVPSSLFCNVSSYKPALRQVLLGFNAFTSIAAPETDRCYTAMLVLVLQHNRIRGGFPLWFASLSSIAVLDVSGNSISGTIPREIGNLHRLEELRLANNSLRGLVPAEIKKCGLLRVLDLEGNRLAGELPAFFGELKGLNVLSAGDNRFYGQIPVTFSNLEALETLNLRKNGLTGELPDELMGLSNLTTVNLSGNKFRGKIPTNIGNLTRLIVLNLSCNGLAGDIPATVGNLYNLASLDFSQQSLSGELPPELLGLPNLQVIALQDNDFSGDVPEGFTSLLSLRYLNLSFNAFSGHIPATFGFLRSLAVLSLSHNRISGQIPPELANCSDLRTLGLRSNTLTGHIPADLRRISHLTNLDLGGNNLTGKIPTEISKCKSLSSLLLDNNHLSGELPPSLALISSLRRFNVSENRLVGEIPEPLASRFHDPSVFTKNQNLCGKPLAVKCKGRSSVSANEKKMTLLIVVIVGGACFAGLFCCFYIFTLLRWRRSLQAKGEKKRSPTQSRSSGASAARGSADSGGAPKLTMFNNKITLVETIEATRRFDEENVLSRTRHGLVFKAAYNDGMVLSVRRLSSALLDESLFRKEAEALGRVKHRNLTVLRGYYAGPPDVRLLVYDYMPNGNLATLLQEASHQDGNVLNWPMRHLIALGVARGLAFLHTAGMVHGDVRPQNVLFDADFEAHLSDFGLDRFAAAAARPGEASTSAVLAGSVGYVAPEAMLTGDVTKESDTYSFGIVVLELLTGKRPVMFAEEGEDIVKWVKRQLQKGQISELLEPGLLDLDPDSPEWEEFLLGVKVGLLCTTTYPLDRPAMPDVVFMLEGCRVGPDMPSSADPTSHPSPARDE